MLETIHQSLVNSIHSSGFEAAAKALHQQLYPMGSFDPIFDEDEVKYRIGMFSRRVGK